MGFGISKFIKFLSLKMIILETKRIRTKNKYKNKNLELSLGCDIINSEFGKNNFLGENVTLTNSFLGDYSYINSGSKLRNTKVGKFCSIGPNVQIILGKHPFDFVSSHPTFYANNKPFETFSDFNYIDEYDNVVIGNDVWIGEGVLIPGGVTIGDGAVITARAVVTKDVEPYSVVGGVPAKFIKYRFTTEIIEEIKASKWWDWPDDKLKASHKLFHKPEFFIKNLLNDEVKKNNNPLF